MTPQPPPRDPAVMVNPNRTGTDIMNRTGEKFLELLELVTRLRAPDGCPWDQKQTPESLKKYLLDEAHEVIAAIDGNDPGHVREELGDLLFQIVFLNRLYEERQLFTMAGILETIVAKMIRRHPHVFGDARAATPEEVREHWIAIKAREEKEKAGDGETSLFASIPGSLPALRRALKVSERVAQTGFDWPAIEPVFDKLAEETGELRRALADNDREAIFEEVGDMLFALVNVGRMAKVNSEEALATATDKFVRRFTRMERTIRADGFSIDGLDGTTLDRYWERTKKEERQG